jgi:histidinol-phosphatase
VPFLASVAPLSGHSAFRNPHSALEDRMPNDPKEWLSLLTQIADRADQIALRYFRADALEVSEKTDASPVTVADRSIEEAAGALLRRLHPGLGIFGEEYGERGPGDGARLIIDPIDGTRNFVRHIPVWATLLALEDAGEVVVGVVHNPVTGDLYTARRGGGARLNGAPIRVSDVGDLWEATLLHAGVRLLRQGGVWDGFVRLVDATERQRGFGDYLGYGLVAEGKAEIYLECDLKPWDLAACRLIVEEAGGRFTDFQGRPTIYDGSALVTNGRLHDTVLSFLAAGR